MTLMIFSDLGYIIILLLILILSNQPNYGQNIIFSIYDIVKFNAIDLVTIKSRALHQD